jgi:Protein of unknown function (DUF3175)
MPTKNAKTLDAGATTPSPAKQQRRKHASPAHRRTPAKKWSGEVTEKSDALDLGKGVFTSDNPQEIAVSLKHSAEASPRRKSDPFRSALSMLTFYINRAGKNLSTSRRRTLTAAKDKLRQLFGHGQKLPVKRVK